MVQVAKPERILLSSFQLSPHLATPLPASGRTPQPQESQRQTVEHRRTLFGRSTGPVILGTGDDLKSAAVISGYYLEPTEVIRGGRADLAPRRA
jgi:hypothetical protein